MLRYFALYSYEPQIKICENAQMSLAYQYESQFQVDSYVKPSIISKENKRP